MDRDSVTKKEFANDGVQDTDSDELVDPISMGHPQKQAKGQGEVSVLRSVVPEAEIVKS